MKKIITCLVATSLLSSCHIYKAYERPDVDIQHLYRDTVTPDNRDSSDTLSVADTVSLGSRPWREVFADPALQSLIEQGLAGNTDLQSALLRVKQAEATLLSSRLAYLPSLKLAPEGTISSFDKQSATRTYQLPVAASWEVDLFGNLLNAKRGAKTALLQSEANYYMVKATLPDLRRQIREAENSLSLLLGQAPQQISRSGWQPLELPEQLSAGIPLQLLANRPDVRQAEMALASAYHNTNGAHSAFYPQITISGSAGWTNNAGEAIRNPARFLATAVGSLVQPLFNKGTNIARLKIAKAQQEEALLNFRQSLLNAGSEVSNALYQFHSSGEKSKQRIRQIASLNNSVAYTQELMRLGTSTYLEVLTAQQSLLTAQLTEVSDYFEQMQAVINLYRALGGGHTIN